MRIVFASLGSLGDLHPMLALARTAESRGHKTVIAASKGFGDYVRSLGFEFRRIRPDLDPTDANADRLAHSTKGPERLLREEIFPSTRATCADLVEAGRKSDLLVVGELVYAAPMAADRLGIPWANVAPSPSSFLSAIDPCVMAPLRFFHHLRHLGPIPHRLLLRFADRLTSGWARPYFEFRRELGLPRGDNPVFAGKHSPFLTLALFPGFFAPAQPDWPPRVAQTGFPFFNPPESAGAAELDAFLRNGSPPVVFTLGSSMIHFAGDFYEQAARAALQIGRRAILLLGKNPAPSASSPDLHCISYARLDDVFARAAAAVHHGGIGSCAMALRHGIPSLVIPFGYDQPDNGERLRRLGVARILEKPSVSTALLAKNLASLLADESMAKRAAALSARIDPAGTLERSVDALEALRARL
jgi:UDP:flavonoid glycosyltransferase YjiC (YdhE family)